MKWKNGKYIKADARFSEVVRQRGNVWELRDIGGKKTYFLVTDGNGKFAHGDTIKEAKEDLVYKISNRDTSSYKGIDTDKKLAFAECVEMYRVITGSCATGVKHFIESAGIKRGKYTVNEIIKIVKERNAYQWSEFEGFFANNK
jgi:hypothetical protein